MSLTQDQLGKIKARVLAKVGDPTEMADLDLSSKGLALCIIDSIQSTGVRYGGVRKVLERYVDYRTNQGGGPTTDGTKELLQTFDELATPEAWATKSATSTRPLNQRVPR